MKINILDIHPPTTFKPTFTTVLETTKPHFQQLVQPMRVQSSPLLSLRLCLSCEAGKEELPSVLVIATAASVWSAC